MRWRDWYRKVSEIHSIHAGEDVKESPSNTMISNASDAYSAEASDLLDEESELLAALGFDPCSLDALQARTGLATPQLQAQLMAMELPGNVARLPGGLFQRIGQS